MNYQSICKFGMMITLLISFVVVSGCKEKPKIEETDSKPVAKKPKLPTSLKGNWLLSVVEHQSDGKTGEYRSASIPVALLKFQPKDSLADPTDEKTAFKTILLDSTSITGRRTLNSADVEGNNIHIVLGGNEQMGSMDFEATFDKGIVRGSALLEKQGNRCLIGRLHPVGNKITKLPPQLEAEQIFKKENDVLISQLQGVANNPQLGYQTILKSAVQNPQRAYSLFLYEYRLLAMAIRFQMPEEKFDEFYKGYMTSAAYWGPRYQTYAHLSMASTVARSSYLPQFAMRHLDELEKGFSEEEKKRWQKMVTASHKVATEHKKRMDEVIKIADLVKKLKSEDSKVQKEGEEGLTKVLVKQPFMIPVLSEMADYYERQKQFDKAIELNAKLTALPKASQTLQQIWLAKKTKHKLPPTILTRLWKKKHGNTDKLDDYILQSYKELLAGIPGEKFTRSGKDAGNHIVLCELFTGANCPPCTAADAASGALEETFAPSELIMLRYHLHANGPDPLANSDNEYRMGYYGIRSTPTFCIDGKKLPPLVGYYLHQAKPIYSVLTKVVEPLLKRKTDLKITLSAVGKGGKLNLSASVTGLKDPPETLRLRLVLAEESIPFAAGNGIRIHEMIVRKMPGGIEGTLLKNGKIEYSEEISLAEFKTDLLEQLDAIEEQNDINSFPIIPMSLQKLHLIGIVQDDKDGSVLQTAIIPVTGKLVYPKTKVAPKTVPAQEATPKKTAPKTNPFKKDESGKEDSKKDKESAFLPLPSQLENVLFKEETKEQPEKKDGNKKKEVIRRETVEGNWILQIHPAPSTGFPVVLLKIKKSEQKKYDLQLIDYVERVGKMKLKSSHLEKTSTSFVLDGNMGKIRFEGALSKNSLVGVVQFEGETATIPAVLRPFLQEKLGKVATELVYDENAKKFIKKVQTIENEDLFQVYHQFAKDNPQSPFTMTIYSDVLFTNAGRAGLSVDDTTQLAKKYIQQAAYWGPQMQQQARLSIAQGLISQKFAPKVAKLYLDEAAKNLKPKSFTDWNLLIKPALTKLEMVTALIDISSNEKELQKKAFGFLSNIQKSDPFNHQAIWALAQHAEREENNKEAMRLYGQLSSLPLMERMLKREWAQEDLAVEPKLPSEDLARLWKNKYGSTEMLDKYLDRIYEKALEAIPGEKYKGREADPKNHVVLCELFTGSQCPPCVAADLSTGALQKTFAPTELIVLRYHQHIPGPDPFANTQGQKRLNYYNGRGTPSVYFDGKPVQGAAGYLEHAKEIYTQLKSLVEKELETKSDINLSVTIKVVGGKMKLMANATGLPKDDAQLRLRLVLAEDHVNYVAGNGIRLHEMVVRSMPGGVEGTKANEGKLQYEESLALVDFKKGILDDLKSFENENGYQFRAKPLTLEKIHLVAFVQNDKTGEVLQSAMVSIKEKLKYPKALPQKEKKEKK